MSDSLASAFSAAGFACIETHISRVYLRGDDVYKTKRPVELGFLDFSSLDARARACEAEVALNRRLAPDVYLGVVGVVRGAGGELAFPPRAQLGDSSVLEWAVHMRRLEERDRADQLLATGALDAAEVARIAERIARFHGQARSDAHTAAFGRPALIERNVEENFSQVQGSIGRYLTPAESADLQRYQRTFLRTHGALFEQRAAAGFVRDGHGDLRLEHLYRTEAGDYLAIDCIEFNERFRFGDVCADLAFLAMDLAHHQRSDLAELLIAAYAQASADYGLYALLDFYRSYRAVVRAKVASLLADDAQVSAQTRGRAEREARRYYLQAISGGHRPLAPPRVIVSFGLIAAGKSTLAQAVATRLGLAVLSADRTRKELLGSAPTAAHHDAAFRGAYAPELTERVYGTLLARAEQLLSSGRSVVLDASFRSREQRARVRALARERGVDAVFLECQSPRDVSLARLRRRAEAPSVSDGRVEIYDDFAAGFEPADELDPAHHAVIDTSTTPDEALAAALALLATSA